MYSIVAAVVAFIIFVITLHFGNKIKNRFARFAAFAAGIVLGLCACGMIASDPEQGSDAGQILAGLIVVSAVVSSIAKRFKKPAADSGANSN